MITAVWKRLFLVLKEKKTTDKGWQTDESGVMFYGPMFPRYCSAIAI